MYDTDVHKIKNQLEELVANIFWEEEAADKRKFLTAALSLIVDQIPTRRDHGQD